jgi:hypothetical protein
VKVREVTHQDADLTGTIDDWRTMLTREESAAQPLSQCPVTSID